MEGDIFEPKMAPEIASNSENWINSPKMTLDELRGRIILLDFWTYSCVNCLRTLRSLREMWKKYKDSEAVMIGIHTPEFAFERDIENVRRAVKKHGIKYPVLNDPERINWHNYGNSFWPRAALISRKGQIIMDHIGESGYDEIDRKIMEELGMEPVQAIRQTKRNYPFFITPEIYAGSLRNEGIGSSKVCTPEKCSEFYDPGNHREAVIYLKGEWIQTPEYLEFTGDSGYVSLKFYAREVNAVLGGRGYAQVFFDGESLDERNAGKGVVFKRWKSFVQVNRPDIYNLISIERYVAGDIRIIPFKGFRIYSYTFG